MVSALGFDVTPANNTTIGTVAAANDMETIKVDDLSRELAASIKSLILDIGGATSTAGSVSAYTITSNGFATSLLAGAMMAFRAHTTNTGAATLNVSALGAKALVRHNTSGETALTGGELVTGGHYLAQYDTAASAAAGAWTLLNPAFNGQLAFPAAQNASSGANVQDDYEEGTWTPAVKFGAAEVGITYTSRSGVYIKIGAFVWASGGFLLSANGSSTGTMTIAGLPFTPTAAGGGGIGPAGGFTGLTGALQLMVAASSTVLTLRQSTSSGNSVIADTETTDTASLSFTCTFGVV